MNNIAEEIKKQKAREYNKEYIEKKKLEDPEYVDDVKQYQLDYYKKNNDTIKAKAKAKRQEQKQKKLDARAAQNKDKNQMQDILNWKQVRVTPHIDMLVEMLYRNIVASHLTNGELNNNMYTTDIEMMQASLVRARGQIAAAVLWHEAQPKQHAVANAPVVSKQNKHKWPASSSSDQKKRRAKQIIENKDFYVNVIEMIDADKPFKEIKVVLDCTSRAYKTIIANRELIEQFIEHGFDHIVFKKTHRSGKPGRPLMDKVDVVIEKTIVAPVVKAQKVKMTPEQRSLRQTEVQLKRRKEEIILHRDFYTRMFELMDTDMSGTEAIMELGCNADKFYQTRKHRARIEQVIKDYDDTL